ncbi:MAG: DeoR family transcriptional regulator, partial [Clostridiales bacterium]|nr:DeoR family transcriptional regulator [Clostridiales bacterium]
MFSEERKDQIISLLQLKNRVTVLELTEKLHVSEATVRRDLQDLEQLGLLKRAHGGAVLNLQNNLEASYTERE